MRAPAGGLAHCRHDIVNGVGVDRELGAEFAGQVQLLVVDINGHHPQTERAGVLHSKVSQAADPGNRHPLTGSGVGDLESLVDRDSGAQNRCDFQRVGAVGDPGREVGIDQHVGPEAAVDGVSAQFLMLAQRFPAGAAVFAPPAGRPQERVAHLVSHREVDNPLTESDNGAVALVTGDERRRRLEWPIPMRGMQIGVAHPRRLHLDQRLTVTRCRKVEFGKLERCTEFGDHGSSHLLRLRHYPTPFLIIDSARRATGKGWSARAVAERQFPATGQAPPRGHTTNVCTNAHPVGAPACQCSDNSCHNGLR